MVNERAQASSVALKTKETPAKGVSPEEIADRVDQEGRFTPFAFRMLASESATDGAPGLKPD